MELSSLNAASWCDLLCEEEAEELGELPTGFPAAGMDSGGVGAEIEFPGDSDESIAGFIEGEAEYSPAVDYPARLRSRSIDPAAREAAISWILQVHAYYRFQPLTAYLSVNYMDRFLSAHPLQQANGWLLQLLSVACLSLAVKMEEIHVPCLLDLQVEGARFIFEPRTICKMELLILTVLKWRLRSVTPFNFIDFFAFKIDPSGIHTRYLVSRAAQTILATITDIGLLDHCPSSIAAASIICAADETPDIIFVDPVNWCIGLATEGITLCCRLMQQGVSSEMQRIRSPLILPHLRLKTLVNMKCEASASSRASFQHNKRRKLSNCLWLGEDDKTSHAAE